MEVTTMTLLRLQDPWRAGRVRAQSACWPMTEHTKLWLHSEFTDGPWLRAGNVARSGMPCMLYAEAACTSTPRSSGRAFHAPPALCHVLVSRLSFLLDLAHSKVLRAHCMLSVLPWFDDAAQVLVLQQNRVRAPLPGQAAKVVQGRRQAAGAVCKVTRGRENVRGGRGDRGCLCASPVLVA